VHPRTHAPPRSGGGEAARESPSRASLATDQVQQHRKGRRLPSVQLLITRVPRGPSSPSLRTSTHPVLSSCLARTLSRANGWPPLLLLGRADGAFATIIWLLSVTMDPNIRGSAVVGREKICQEPVCARTGSAKGEQLGGWQRPVFKHGPPAVAARSSLSSSSFFTLDCFPWTHVKWLFLIIVMSAMAVAMWYSITLTGTFLSMHHHNLCGTKTC
jgi:hypothetical protein